LMRRKGQGSASISAVVVFLSALLAIGLMATILPPVANVLSGFREGLRERGERGSELIRIYIHSANETELEPPIITIINGYDRESILTDYVVVARDGRILAAGKMGGSLGGIRIPAGARIDMTPADFGLSYGTFAAMADEVKAIYVRTAEGNSFGSSYGPPPKINPDYQLSITQRSQHIIVIGSTVTSYNFTILGNLTLPTTGDAMVVKNVILVDRNGFVRGGVTAGKKWSDGSFDPNKIPDSVAAITKTDVVPIGGYYSVPPFPMDYFNCDYSNPRGIFSVYRGCDTGPRYIEMVEFYPVEYYTPGSPVAAAAYYARYGGETQTVYNPDLGRVVTITAQRPVKVVQYGYGIPGTYTMTVPTIAMSTYTTTVTATTTLTYTVLSTSTTTSISNYRQSKQCTAPSGYNLYCSFTINPPSGSFVVRAIKEVGYTVSGSGSSYICSTSVGSGIQYVKVTTPWGTYTFTSTSWSTSGNFPVGSVTFELAVYYSWVSMGCSATITGWVVYELLNYVTTVSSSTATATYLVARTTLGTTTYSTTTAVPVAVWAEDRLVKFAPIFDPSPAYSQQSGNCGVLFGSNGGTKTCGFTVNPPSGPLTPIAIKEVGYTVSTSTWGYCSMSNKPGVGINYVKVMGPWGTYTLRDSSWKITNVNYPFGSIIFELSASMSACYPNWYGSAAITGWVVYEFYWSGVTATATLAISGNFRDQIKSAIVNGTETLSGDAVAHLAGTVQGGQIIKVKAPIVLLNYIYGIASSPPAPPSGGGGGGGEIGVRYVCTVDESAQIKNPPSPGTGSSGSGSSPSSPSPQPAPTISGNTGPPDYYFLNMQVQVLRRGVCRPI